MTWNVSQEQGELERIFQKLEPKELEQIRNERLQHREYRNNGYCFVTLSTVNQAKLIYYLINEEPERVELLKGTRCFLRGETEHWHYDAEHLIQKFNGIQKRLREHDKSVSRASETLRKELTTEEKRKNVQNMILEQANDTSYTGLQQKYLESELLSKKEDVWQSKYLEYLDVNAKGRNFKNNLSSSDVLQFQSELLRD